MYEWKQSLTIDAQDVTFRFLIYCSISKTYVKCDGDRKSRPNFALIVPGKI